jgi:hypothetical protein
VGGYLVVILGDSWVFDAINWAGGCFLAGKPQKLFTMAHSTDEV